jgi:hypothetical protein
MWFCCDLTSHVTLILYFIYLCILYFYRLVHACNGHPYYVCLLMELFDLFYFKMSYQAVSFDNLI